jgi:high-affinity nickel-transport protein
VVTRGASGGVVRRGLPLFKSGGPFRGDAESLRGANVIQFIRNVLNDADTGIRKKVAGLYLILALANFGAWAWAFEAFGRYPVLLGTALLAYSFGLRHAVDADHIAAIDNVTRKLMQEGKRPVGVGFFFSLGHSLIVILASAAVALAASAFKGHLDAFESAGGLIGTSISAFFLLAIALANLWIFLSIYRIFQRARRGEPIVADDLDMLLAQRGFLARAFRRLFRLVGKSRHMFPIGVLFGLGFDTATEIALLAVASAEAAKGLPIWSIMVFPTLFTAGMTLIDTTDGVLMLGAYGWAFEKPMRKLFYNMTMTFVSVVVALVIGGIEALGLIADNLHLEGRVWRGIGTLNDNFGTLGYAIIAIFVLTWIGSIAIYRIKRYDRVDVKT